MKRFLRLALATGAVLVLPAVGTVPSLAAGTGAPAKAVGAGTVTVGEFLVRYAHAMKLPVAANAGQDEILSEMKDRGVIAANEPVDRPLTEGDVVRFASRSGLRLTTLDAERLFTSAKVDSFFDTFGGVLGTPDVTAPGTELPGTGDALTVGTDTCDPNVSNCGAGSERAREKRKKKKDRETPPSP